MISIDKGNSRQFSQSQLEEATTYVFVVRGLYDGGVVGEDAVVMVTTLEDGTYEMSCTTCIREHFHHIDNLNLSHHLSVQLVQNVLGS